MGCFHSALRGPEVACLTSQPCSSDRGNGNPMSNEEMNHPASWFAIPAKRTNDKGPAQEDGVPKFDSPDSRKGFSPRDGAVETRDQCLVEGLVHARGCLRPVLVFPGKAEQTPGTKGKGPMKGRRS